MSLNQSKGEKSEAQLRRPGRSGNSSQQGSFGGGGGGGGKGGGGGAAAPPLSSPLSSGSGSSSAPALAASRSFKKSSNGQGGQSRMGAASLNSQSNAAVANSRITQNGAHGQSQLHDAPASSIGKRIDSSVTKSSRALPKAPSSQPASGSSESATPVTPSKGDVSKAFPLQFGSISPGFMNGMQIPARTSSAPPNLDEQKRDQARDDSSKAMPTLPIPSARKTQPLKKNVSSTNQPNIVESHPLSQTKRDARVQIPAGSGATTTQKSTAMPITGISMPMLYQQPQLPLQFGAPSAQMPAQGVTAGSLQIPMPLPVGNTAQVQQQVFVSGLQSHPLQPQGMMHQGQSLGFAPQMAHQLGNLGIGMTPPFAAPQQSGKFGGTRKTVKITHPETHEELKLDKRADLYSDVGSSGPRGHPNVPPQNQPIQSFSPAHSMNYFSTIQPNCYTPSMFYPNPTSVPLTSTQMTPGSSATRYNHPVGQGGPPMSFMIPSVSKAGPPVHGVTEPSNLEQGRDGYMASASAPSASVRVTVKPAVKPLAEKALTSVTVNSPASKGESHKLMRQPGEASASNQQIDNDVCLDNCLKQPKSVSETSDFMLLPASIKHSTYASASVPLHGLPSNTSSVPTTPAELSDAVVTKADAQRRDPFKRSDSLKDQQRKPGKKELQFSDQQHQVDSVDSANRSNSIFVKLSGDVGPSDLNVEQASENPDNLQTPSASVAELVDSSSTPSRNLESNVSFSLETEKGNALSSLESSGMNLEASEELSQDANATCCDASATLADGVLDGEGCTCESSNPPALDVGGNASEKSDTLLHKEKGGHISLGLSLKQETTIVENSITAIADGSVHDRVNSEVHTGSTVSESASDKQTEVVLQHVAIPENAQEINVFGESKRCDFEVGRPVDNLVMASSTGAPSVSIDGRTAPPSCISSTDASEEKTSSITSSKTDGQVSGSGILSRETATSPPAALPEMTRKHEGRVAESNSGGQTSTSSLVSKDKIPMDQNRTKSTPGKRKKMKEILMKADAAGTTSDLYLAYKGPEEKHETSITSESMDSTAADENHACVERDTVTPEDGQNKSELDDWEDAAEIPTPKLKTSENGELVPSVTKPNDKYEGGITGKKKYTRDFLLTFSDPFSDLPAGFKIGSDMVDALMGGHVASSHLVDRDSYTSSGRIIDRGSGGSRNDRRGSGIVDDDKWGKAPGCFASGRDPRADGTGGMAVNFRPGQAGNHGVLRNPRGQSSGLYVGGILSGPMQALASPGGMARNSPDVDRWQRAKGLIPAPLTPLQAMHKAEKKYEVGKVSDKEVAKQRQLKAILNKLTPQNFEKLFQQVKEVDIDNAITLTGVISQIFDKALMEPTFCEMYANFCQRLAGVLPDFGEDNEKITFKRLLLNKCQEEFERGEREQAEANRVEEGEIKQSDEEREEKRVKARRRMLGNIRLIGELYNKKMLTERIMHECIKKLLGQYQNPDEEDIEALCKLMSTIGEMIDHQKAKEHMDAYFEFMLKLSNNQRLSSRVRFMLKDAIDLRKNKWQQRRKVEGPKKIEEVHRDAAQERQLQTSRLSRSGSGISSVRRGQPIDYGPRGSTAPSSLNAQPMSVLRSVPPHLRGYGTQDVRLEDRLSHESKMPSIPLPQRPIDDDSITLGPQGGLARGMSIRGQPLMPSVPLDVSTSGEPRRMAPGPNGCSPASDWTHYNSREEPMQRYVPERSMATPVFEQSNSLERNRSFGGRDFRIVDRSFDRSMAGSPATGRVQGSTSGAQNVPLESKISEDNLRDMSIAAIREYYSARNEEEIRLCIKELNSPSFYPNMVMLWVADSFDRKNEIDRELLAKLLVNLCNSRDGLLSQVQLIKGFEAVLSTLEDAVTDSPKAAEYLGRMLGKVVSEKAVPLRDIGRIIYDGGDEPGRLLETGLASDVLFSIFEFLKRDRGEAILHEMWRSSNLRLEDFQHPDPIRSRRLEAFM